MLNLIIHSQLKMQLDQLLNFSLCNVGCLDAKKLSDYLVGEDLYLINEAVQELDINLTDYIVGNSLLFRKLKSKILSYEF